MSFRIGDSVIVRLPSGAQFFRTTGDGKSIHLSDIQDKPATVVRVRALNGHPEYTIAIPGLPDLKFAERDLSEVPASDETNETNESNESD